MASALRKCTHIVILVTRHGYPSKQVQVNVSALHDPLCHDLLDEARDDAEFAYDVEGSILMCWAVPNTSPEATTC
jgi:hypothetical protein